MLLKNTLLSASLFILILVTGCQPKQDTAEQTSRFTNAHGGPFVIGEVPQRIVSCSPAITELMFALGEEKRLVGRTTYCMYPPEVANVEAIGGLADPCIECILNLKPDLVMASTHFKRQAAVRIEELGMPFAWLMSQESVEGAGDLITSVGQLIGVEEKADSLWTAMKEHMQATMDKLPKDAKKPRVYYAVGFGKDGDYTAGGDTFIGELITMAGGINVAADVSGWSYNLEALIQADPDMVIIQHSMKDNFCNYEHYRDLRAVKNNQVFAIDNQLVQLNGSRIHIALREFAKLLYPEVWFEE